MNEQFIPYELAVRLYHLGFDLECFAWWNYGNIVIFGYDNLLDGYAGEDENRCVAPLWQQAFEWIRENHGLNSWITSKTNSDDITIYIPNGRTIPDTIKIGLIVDIIPYAGFKSYKEAQLACLDKLIEIIKTKK